MIIARLKRNTRLVDVDHFVQNFIKKEGHKHFDIDVKLTDTACLIYFFKRFN